MRVAFAETKSLVRYLLVRASSLVCLMVLTNFAFIQKAR